MFGGVPSGWNSEQHLVLLDQLARLLDGLGRVVAVVERLMYLILRPLMPPSALTLSKYAPIDLPIEP